MCMAWIPIFFVRYSFAKNHRAYADIVRLYDPDVIGQVMEHIFSYHKGRNITYTLSDEVEGVFEVIIDKLNDQFNLKYMTCSQIAPSQPELNSDEKSKLSVCTKATEIIGCLACILLVYCNSKFLYTFNHRITN